jgi:hypothetical protein
MQMDFHYDVVYVLAQMAGFTPEEAVKLATSSQYVDDATSSSLIEFNNGCMYKRISTSHGTFDLRNNDNPADANYVWAPFHFMPGNDGLPAGTPEGAGYGFTSRLVCQPDSLVARDVVLEALKHKGERTGLHRLGITLHVYADTWTHQGFAGIITERNKIQNLILSSAAALVKKLDNLELDGINQFLPLGHAAVLTYPDLPYIGEWSFDYTDGRPSVKRNNLEIFINASNRVFKILTLYKNGTVPKDAATLFDGLPDLPEDVQEHFKKCFTNFTGNTRTRHNDWMKEINASCFDGVEAIPDYHEDGEGSWEYAALGEKVEDKYSYIPGFLNSDWHLFQDAAIQHRTFVLNTLFPKYGIAGI